MEGEYALNDPYNVKDYLKTVLPTSCYEKRGVSQPLPNDKLGIKVSFITRNWRRRERELHAKSLSNMQSPLKREIDAHEFAFHRANKILGCGKNNKEKALRARLEKVERENSLMAKRLQAVLKAPREVGATSERNREIRARVTRRRKNLLHARELDKQRIDYENGLLLDRLQRTKPSLVDTQTLLKQYHQCNRVKRTMCKLEVGYDEARRMQQSSRRSTKRPTYQREQLPALQRNELGNYILTASTPEYSHTPDTPTKCSEARRCRNGTPDTYRSFKRRNGVGDRGQVFQQHVWLRAVPSATESTVEKEQVALAGFNLKDKRRVRFEVTTYEGLVLEVEVPYKHVRSAFEESASKAIDQGSAERAQINLATASADKLVLFGQGDKCELVWSN